MGREKRGLNRHNPVPLRGFLKIRTFAQAVKTLFCIIQYIHNFVIANDQQNGTLTNTSEATFADASRVVQPTCSASLGQQIELISSRRLHNITAPGVTLQRDG